MIARISCSGIHDIPLLESPAPKGPALRDSFRAFGTPDAVFCFFESPPQIKVFACLPKNRPPLLKKAK